MGCRSQASNMAPSLAGGRLLKVAMVISLLFVLSSARPYKQMEPGLDNRVELVHILNSPRSPYFKGNLTSVTRLNTLRSMELPRLAERHRSGPATGRHRPHQLPMQYGGTGTYFIRASFGSPPQPIDLMVDTGSDTIWFQCVSGHFLMSQSESFRLLPCSDDRCRTSPNPNCDPSTNKVCEFAFGYDGGDKLSGNMGTEIVHIGGLVLPNIAVGCARQLSGGVSTMSGIIGLGRGDLSLIGQAAHKFEDAFSYCLADFHGGQFPSYLNFGRDRSINLAWTPMLGGYSDYGVQVDALLIGNKPAPIDKGVWNMNGGTLFDTGTTNTYIQPAAFDALKNVYSKVPGFMDRNDFVACFEDGTEIPSFAFALGGGAIFQPPVHNIAVEQGDGSKCVTIFKASDGWPTLLGNLLQQGFHIENDVRNKKIGFAQTGCRH